MKCAFALMIASFVFLCLPSAAQQITSRPPDGLAISTGNLYFTAHDAAGAAVWRTSQQAVPGQETILYWEAGALFGDIVFEKTGNAWFGYFFAQKAGTITIRRVSLTGGNATILATVNDIDIANSHHNLVTDGINLYWQNAEALWKMSIGGGAVSKLDDTRPNTPTGGISLQNHRLIYADVDTIRFVPVTGATTPPHSRIVAVAHSPVTTLHAPILYVYWGERNGAVRRILNGFATPETLQQNGSQLPTAMATVGSEYAWAQCGSAACVLQASFGTGTTLGAGTHWVFLQSGGWMFRGNATGIHRQHSNRF